MLHFDTFSPAKPGGISRFCPGASAGARLRALLSGFYFRKKYRLLRRALLRLKPSRIY
jgi:hypothetical protein